MKLLDMICKELGVEAEEEWLGSDGNEYKFDKQGNLLKYYKLQSDWLKEPYSVSDIVKGELKPVWKPNEGEFYFTPNLQLSCGEKLFNVWKWQKFSPSSKWHDKLGIMYRTKEEAIAAANKMLEAIKER